jgi:beta-glucanase (GH16 family)
MTLNNTLRKIFFGTVPLCIALTTCSCSSVNDNDGTALPEVEDKEQWGLVWQDEFTDNNLDETKWTRCRRGRSNWNDTMSDDSHLLVINDGVLHLRGIENINKESDPAPYLTAGVTSKGKYFFEYGKVQIRARFKSAQGAWPALWLMPETKPQAG